jgi:hypothetical protein
MIQEKKKSIRSFDINKQLQDQIASSKMIKYAIYSVSVIGGILAVGFLAKVFNYSLKNLADLNKTLKIF